MCYTEQKHLSVNKPFVWIISIFHYNVILVNRRKTYNVILSLIILNIINMNETNIKYYLYLEISNNWELDDWSIRKEGFDKIVEILPFGKTILEIGSGRSTYILSHFYKMISIESSDEWMGKYNSEYLYVPCKKTVSTVFGETTWLDRDILTELLKDKEYDLLIVDAGFDRVGIYDNFSIFKNDIPIIFDDTMNENYFKCANLLAKKLNKCCVTYHCLVNKYANTWLNGKKYSLII